jgi:photosystem II stability/assembly factor-like uncharacterized protein
MKEKSPFKDLKWRMVGPRFCGGRIESIAVHPDSPYTLYVGVGAGNIWKSVNNGITWTPIFDNESTFTIGEIATAPSDPNIIWVGTGEVLMARSSYAGTGVFKSLDSGKTWKNMGLHDSHHIGRVLIHPENPDIVYVAAIGHNFSYNEERGLFKTTDGGRTWNKILYISEKVGVVDVEMDPEDDQILYACTWERDRKAWGHIVGGVGSAFYKSTNEGRNWKKITSGLPTGEHVGRMGVEVSVKNPKVLYMLLDNQTQRPEKDQTARRRRRKIGGEVYRSEDKGESWVKVNQDYLQTAIGYDFNLMRISPDDENEIYVGGNRFLHSKDGGRTYRRIGGTVVHLLRKDKREFSLDQHALWIDPANPDRIILGNDHGIYMSYDRAHSWLHVNNLPIGEFYAVSVDMATPYNIYGGNYFTERDPTDPDVVYYEHQHGVIRRKNMKTGETKDIMPRSPEGEPPLRRNWMTPYIMSHYDPKTLYYGAQKLFKSTDRGDSWVCISPDLSTDSGLERQNTPPYGGLASSSIPYGTITTISESPIKPGLIYIGTDDGNVQVTMDEGKTWTLIRKGLPRKWVTRVIVSKFHEGTVYVSLTGYREDDFSTYIYMSADFGHTWASIVSNLPSDPVNVIREDPQKENILYIGTDLGVYASLDKGKSWHSLCLNLPTTPVYDLVVHPRDGELVAGTHGRSIYVMDIKPIQDLQ